MNYKIYILLTKLKKPTRFAASNDPSNFLNKVIFTNILFVKIFKEIHLIAIWQQKKSLEQSDQLLQ